MPKIRPCVSLEADQLAFLRELARDRGSNVSAVLRELIEQAREDLRRKQELEREHKRKLAERTRSWRNR